VLSSCDALRFALIKPECHPYVIGECFSDLSQGPEFRLYRCVQLDVIHVHQVRQSVLHTAVFHLEAISCAIQHFRQRIEGEAEP